MPCTGCRKNKNGSPDFSYNGSRYLGGTLQFTTSSLSAKTLLWNFGDGSTSTDIAPAHTYTWAGRFTVTLFINGDSSNTLSKTLVIGADSVHEAMLNETKTFHEVTEGFYPPAGKDTAFDDGTASYSALSIGVGTIIFKGDTLYSHGSDDSALYFVRVFPGVSFAPPEGNFTYNFLSGKMVYEYSYYTSAGGGIWADVYTSL